MALGVFVFWTYQCLTKSVRLYTVIVLILKNTGEKTYFTMTTIKEVGWTRNLCVQSDTLEMETIKVGFFCSAI